MSVLLYRICIFFEFRASYFEFRVTISSFKIFYSKIVFVHFCSISSRLPPLSPQDWYDKWTSTNTTKGRFVRDILKHKTDVIRTKLHGVTAPTIYDALAMAITINPDTITKVCSMYVRVELLGQYTRGQMVQIVRYDGTECQRSDGAKVDILIKVNVDILQNMLMKAVE